MIDINTSRKKDLDKVKIEIEHATAFDPHTQQVLDSVSKYTKTTIANLPAANSEHYKKWLVEQRDIRKNPFIGKGYLESAEDHNVDQEKADYKFNPNENIKEFMKNLDEMTKEYIPDVENSMYDEGEESLRDESFNKDKLFIDFTTAQNIATKLIGKSEDEIESSIKEELCRYHNNPNYESEIDFKLAIETAKYMMIEDKTEKNDIKLISNKLL